MLSQEIRDALVSCRLKVTDADLDDPLQVLARDLLDHLLELYDAKRLRLHTLLLALDSLELVPGTDDEIGALRAMAALEQARLNSLDLGRSD